LSYAEFNASVITSAIFNQTITAAGVQKLSAEGVETSALKVMPFDGRSL